MKKPRPIRYSPVERIHSYSARQYVSPSNVKITDNRCWAIGPRATCSNVTDYSVIPISDVAIEEPPFLAPKVPLYLQPAAAAAALHAAL